MRAWPDMAAAVDAAVDAGLGDLFDAIRIPSVVAWGGDHVRDSARFLRRLLERDGWSAELVEVGTNAMVFAEIGRSPNKSAVMLYGHHDVQPPEPLAAWTTPPFDPVIRDGRIFARGAADNKGQFFAHIFAVRALRRLLGDVPAHLKFFLDGEEEGGNHSLAETLQVLRPRLAADFVFTIDGPAHSTGQPRVTFGFRGNCQLRFTVRTSGTNLHSGHWGNLAPDAAVLLAQILAAIKGPDGWVCVPGFYDGVRPPDEVERAAIDAIPFDADAVAASIGARHLTGPDTVRPMERMMFLPTFTVTGLTAGYTGIGGQYQNAIPSQAVAQVDIRYVPDQDPDQFVAAIRDFVGQITPECTVERVAHHEPSRTRMDNPYTPIVVEAIRKGFGVPPLLFPCSGGSAPESLFTKGLGLPSLWAHLANFDARNHAPDENLQLAALRAAARTSAALILELARR